MVPQPDIVPNMLEEDEDIYPSGDGEPMAETPVHVNAVSMTALTVAIVAIFYLGILPTQLLNLAAQSIATIF